MGFEAADGEVPSSVFIHGIEHIRCSVCGVLNRAPSGVTASPCCWCGNTLIINKGEQLAKRGRDGYKIGDFVVRLNSEPDLYRRICPGTLCYVRSSGDHFRRNYATIFSSIDDMAVLPLMADGPVDISGKLVPVTSSLFRLATKQDIERVLEQAKAMRSILARPENCIGAAVTVTKRFVIEIRSFFFTDYLTVPVGTTAVIDYNPALNGSTNADDAGELFDGEHGTSGCHPSAYTLEGTSYKYSDFVAPRVNLHFPEDGMDHAVMPDVFTLKTYTSDLFNQLVLDGRTKERVLTAISRVQKKEVHDRVYGTLGLDRLCQKGRGAIVLLYGPPGTGKTMTAEAVADHVKSPLIRVSLGNVFNMEKIAEALKDAFTRARRYKAVLLIDEVDIFIKKRGDHPITDGNTSTFLRTLEYFDGILFLTTNLVGAIDPAVFSRVHVCVGYEQPDIEGRITLWRTMIPAELLAQVTGDEARHELMLSELASFSLNGREIKMTIQNAVTRAVRNTNNNIPSGTKWISPSCFVDEARLLAEQRDELKRGV